MLKKWLSALLSASMLMSGIGLPVLANEQDSEIEEMESIVKEMDNEIFEEELIIPEAGSIVHSGKIGTADWTIDSNGTLTIGEGEFENEDTWFDWPWWTFSREIKYVDGTAHFIAKKNFGNAFGFSSVEFIDLSGWDTSHLTNAIWMFAGGGSLKKIEISNWDTSSLECMIEMFYGCNKLESLDLSNWNLPKLKKDSISGIFGECSKLKFLKLPNWDTSSVTNMNSIFDNCSSLESLDLSSWNTSSATHMHGLFKGCSNLQSLNISGWNTSKVTYKDRIFQDCDNLYKINCTSGSENIISQLPNNFKWYLSLSGPYAVSEIPPLDKKTLGFLLREDHFDATLGVSYILPDFDTSKDTFSFINDYEPFYLNKEDNGNGYQLNSSFIISMAESKGFKPSDIATFLKKNKGTWGGSCYGMVQSMMENYKKIFPLTNKDSSEFLSNYLIDLDPPKQNSKVLNAVNFRQLLCSSAAWDYKTTQFIESQSGGERLQQLVDQLTNIQNTKNPVSISYEGVKENGDITAHCVLAYGIKNGNFTLRNKNYRYKVLLADPNTADYSISQETSPYILINDGCTEALLVGGESNASLAQKNEPTIYTFYTGDNYSDLSNDELIQDILPRGHFIFTHITSDVTDAYDTSHGADSKDWIYIEEKLKKDIFDIAISINDILLSLTKESELETNESNGLNGVSKISFINDNGEKITALKGIKGKNVKIEAGNGETSFFYQDKFISLNSKGKVSLIFENDEIILNSKNAFNCEITQNDSYVDNTLLYTMKIQSSATDNGIKINFNNQTIEALNEYSKINVELSNLLGNQTLKTEITNEDIIKFNDLNKLGSNLNPIVSKISMYRLYNPNSGEHFYTADSHEKDVLMSLGWNYEGVGWNAPNTSTTPVYRLYNENAGDHHYTTDKNEKDTLVRIGWNDEGTGWYSDDNKGKSLYRVYNPNAKTAGSHHYTLDSNEKNRLVSIGWEDEGIAWYGLK